MARPTLRQLRYLVTLSEVRHFGRAAEACAVSQSALSAGIQDLEDTLQVTLVDRSRRQVALTPAGEETADRARRILADIHDLVQTAQSGRAPLTGPLHLGVIPTIAPFFLPRVLPGLRARFPDLQLFLREDQTERLIDRLEQGRLDVLVMAFPYAHPGIATLPLFEDAFRLCRTAAPTGPAPTLGGLNPADLLLLEDGHCLRDHVVAACRLSGRGPLNTFQATSLHTLVQMVENGLGATLVPEMAVNAGILSQTRLQAERFADAEPTREIGLAWRTPSARADEFTLLGQTLTDLWAQGAPIALEPRRS